MTLSFASFDRCGNCAAVLMSKYYQQWNMQVFRTVFKTTQLGIRSHIARHSHNKQIPKTLIKYKFRWDPGIGATQNLGVWILPENQLLLTVGSQVWMLITVLHVTSVSRLQFR